MKARWIWRRGWNETGWKERSRNEERKGATKTRPKKRNENNISKGVDEHKKQSQNGRQKRKTRENDKLRVVLKKRILGGGGGKRAKHLSNCRKPFVCISYKSTPFEKTQNCREDGVFFYHNLKAKQQTQTKKGRSPKKNRNKEHNNNPDTNNRETRSPQMQETWVWKGDAMELALKGSNKLKKGRKKKGG